MIKRIVKMSFHASNVETFLKLYDHHWTAIRSFAGCEHVELLQDVNEPTLFFTYSHWLSEDHLESYRSSDLFKGIWSSTKPLFSEKAQAWSVKQRL